MNLFNLDKKVALITGGNGGIGYAMAKAMGDAGAKKFIELLDVPNFQLVDEINPSSRFMGKISLNKYKSKDFQDVMFFEPYYVKDFHLIKKKDRWVRS